MLQNLIWLPSQSNLGVGQAVCGGELIQFVEQMLSAAEDEALGAPLNEGVHLLRFLLDLNVGILDPASEANSNLWIYPNPISGQFNLQFTLTQKKPVRIQMFDMQGQLVQSLQENELFDSGAHNLSLNCPEQLPSGNYVLTLEVAGEKRSSVQVFKH